MPKRRKKVKPRLPVEALIRTGSHPQTTKKGKRGYNRKRMKRLLRSIIRENTKS